MKPIPLDRDRLDDEVPGARMLGLGFVLGALVTLLACWGLH